MMVIFHGVGVTDMNLSVLLEALPPLPEKKRRKKGGGGNPSRKLYIMY